MKTEDLKEQGLTQEQINFVMAENGKDLKAITSERDSIKKKLEAAEADRDTYKGQLETANTTLEKFKDIDPEKITEEIETYKKAAETAKAEADKQIMQRDQRDYLKAEFDKLGISSERTRKSLMADIMGEDGLKWKNGSFLGLEDYLKQENEKDHFYQTEEEKQAEADKQNENEKKEKAAGSVPKFTDKSEPKKEPPKDDSKVPVIF